MQQSGLAKDSIHGSGRGRLAVSIGIAAYLGILLLGLYMHTFDTPGKRTLPSYLVVWDMFCGWNSYERRLHFIAEGESGRFYDASEVPGRAVTPHGPVARRHFDFHNIFVEEMATHVLARTEHEPIRRIHVVEEHWPKRFNLPENWLGQLANDTKKSYWHTQAVVGPDGVAIRRSPLWAANQRHRAIFDNPRLRAAADRNRTLFAAN